MVGPSIRAARIASHWDGLVEPFGSCGGALEEHLRDATQAGETVVEMIDALLHVGNTGVESLLGRLAIHIESVEQADLLVPGLLHYFEVRLVAQSLSKLLGFVQAVELELALLEDVVGHLVAGHVEIAPV